MYEQRPECIEQNERKADTKVSSSELSAHIGTTTPSAGEIPFHASSRPRYLHRYVPPKCEDDDESAVERIVGSAVGSAVDSVSSLSAGPPLLRPFRLYGPDGNPILPRVWDQIILPGDVITMRFQDRKLNGAGAHPITWMETGIGWVRSWWSRGLVNRTPPKNGQQRIKFARGKKDTDAESVGDASSQYS